MGEGSRTGVDVGAPVTASNHGSNHTYTLDGSDKDYFEIGTSNGQIRTRSGMTYDFETTNRYSVTVEADDGNGGSESIPVIINVTDVEEKPTKPAVPTVENVAGNTRALYVTWTAPSNVGRPPVLSYDLQYREGNSGPWFNGPQDQTGANASIADLSPGTEYEVQVRATNKDGDGPWSDEGSAFTSQPLPATCASSENENIRLADGYTSKEGRVEICLEDPDTSGSHVWGSICDDYWTDEEAGIVCKTLGYYNSEPIGGRFLKSNFGGRLPILLDDLVCVGNESNIVDCPVADGGIARNAIGVHNCAVSESVGVRCLTEGEFRQHVEEIPTDNTNQSAMLSVADTRVVEAAGAVLEFPRDAERDAAGHGERGLRDAQRHGVCGRGFRGHERNTHLHAGSDVQDGPRERAGGHARRVGDARREDDLAVVERRRCADSRWRGLWIHRQQRSIAPGVARALRTRGGGTRRWRRSAVG